MRLAKRIRLLAFYAIILLLAGGAFFMYYYIKPEALHYTEAVYGTITHESKVAAVFANRETVLQAPCSGKVSLAGADGLRVRRGETVLHIIPDGAGQVNSPPSGSCAVITPEGGLLYGDLDGLETIMTPDNLVSMDLNRLLQEKPSPRRPEKVQTGEAAGKVVDNLSPSSAFIAMPLLESMEIGKTLRFSINGLQQTAKIQRKCSSPQGVVVQFNQFINDSVKQRFAELIWIERPPVSGTVIPSKAIVIRGEEQGIYVVIGGVVKFRSVKVLDDNGEQACVENLPVGISVVLNPRDGIEGKLAR